MTADVKTSKMLGGDKVGSNFLLTWSAALLILFRLNITLSPGFEGVGQPFLAIPVLSANVAFPQVE